MRLITLIAMAAFSIAATAPAVAQDAIMQDGIKSGSMTKMSAADTRKMKACNAMPHNRMMRNAGCKKMMKTHPDMMTHDAMMKKGG